MRLPDPLPTDPDELEALYQQFVEQGDYSQDDHDRLMRARLRAWGVDPENMSAEQLIAAMQDSMSRMLVNLRMAMDLAPDAESEAKLTEVIDMAEKLREDIDKALHDVKGQEARGSPESSL